MMRMWTETGLASSRGARQSRSGKPVSSPARSYPTTHTTAELPAGVTDDPGNKADSPETVREIEAHNAKYDALCPPSE